MVVATRRIAMASGRVRGCRSRRHGWPRRAGAMRDQTRRAHAQRRGGAICVGSVTCTSARHAPRGDRSSSHPALPRQPAPRGRCARSLESGSQRIQRPGFAELLPAAEARATRVRVHGPRRARFLVVPPVVRMKLSSVWPNANSPGRSPRTRAVSNCDPLQPGVACRDGFGRRSRIGRRTSCKWEGCRRRPWPWPRGWPRTGGCTGVKDRNRSCAFAVAGCVNS